MSKTLFAIALLAASCGNSDNVIVGGAGAGDTTPTVLFDQIGSAIHGAATMHDQNGNPIGDKMAVIILSDVPNLCARLKARPDYFRNPTEPFEALIMVVPYARLGTFIIGRQIDHGTLSEIVAVRGPQVPTPFVAAPTSYISVTNWADNGEATGSFNMLFADPYGSPSPYPFYGRFKTNPCTTLEGTLLP